MAHDTEHSATGLDKIIFTTLLRQDIAAKLGFASMQPRRVLAFLKKIDWNDTYITDKVVQAYLERVAYLAQDQWQEKHGKSSCPSIRVTWGVPLEDEDKKLARPQMRVLIRDVDDPAEDYEVTFTPMRKEEKPSEHTRFILDSVRNMIKKDLDIDIAPPMRHPIYQVSDMEVGDGAYLAARNAYEGEGASWDIVLPGDQIRAALCGLLSHGTHEISSGHIPRPSRG